VIWFYERSGAYLRCETREVETRTDVFELVVLNPDGTETVERFDNSESLLRRQMELETALTHEGWQGPFGRFF
jgi:hypothetical protein